LSAVATRFDQVGEAGEERAHIVSLFFRTSAAFGLRMPEAQWFVGVLAVSRILGKTGDVANERVAHFIWLRQWCSFKSSCAEGSSLLYLRIPSHSMDRLSPNRLGIFITGDMSSYGVQAISYGARDVFTNDVCL
jgi:hypothetical protein